MTTDPFANHRPALLEAVQVRVDAVPQHYAAVLRQHLEPAGESDAFLLPGLLCLLTAETFDADPAVAEPAASSLVLLGAMAEIFATIPAEPAGESLLRTWGLPRTLNAGDAFFALAQQSVIEAHGISPERRLAGTRLLDTAARQVAESLNNDASGVANDPSALLSTAMALGALFAGADDSTIERVRSYDGGPSGSFDGLQPDAEARLKAAFAHAREVGQ